MCFTPKDLLKLDLFFDSLSEKDLKNWEPIIKSIYFIIIKE